MTIELRRAGADDFTAIAELDGASFGYQYGEQDLADARLDMDPERALVAVDGDRLVGVSAELPLCMSVPGGEIRAMGLTWVSVEITHRRRGIQRALIEQQLREHAADGWTASALTASEGGIYGRYGYGAATHARRTVVDRHRARLRESVDASAVRRLSTAEARPLLLELHERWRVQTPGAVTRWPQRWELMLLDRERHRNGMSGLFHLVHPDGYVSYRVRTDGADGDARHVCRIVDYVPVTPAAHAALWQTLLGMDLVSTIESERIPLDDPLGHLLTDARQVRTTWLRDDLWLRPLDIAGLLSARSYAVEVEMVLGVTDRLLGSDRYLLRGGPGAAAECERVDRPADVALDAAALGAVVLGGVRLAELARAGRASGDTAALERLDRALLADRLPFLGTGL
ncbi:MAG TPA: GNAT family N-acetyltransferase [Jatrophihabitantaceae bacterium]|nr:GNAT family N-acetyltransferase [Jatrophihabitantaceae bacterium]